MVISRLDVVAFTGLYEAKEAESSARHQRLDAIESGRQTAAAGEIGEPGGA